MFSLLAHSYHFLASRKSSVAIGVLAFTMLLAVNQAFFARKIDAQVAKIEAETKLTDDQFQTQLADQLQNGGDDDQTKHMISALRESMNTGKPVESIDPLTQHNASLYYFVYASPFLLAMICIGIVVSCVSFLFFLLLALQEGRGAYEVAQGLPGKIFPMTGLFLWLVVRSFVWIPFVGPVIALLLLPRFWLSPVLLLSGREGVFGSVRSSFTRTKGYWSLLMGRFLGLIAFLLFALWLSLGVVDLVASFLPKLGLLALFLILELAVAFAATFQVQSAMAITRDRK